MTGSLEIKLRDWHIDDLKDYQKWHSPSASWKKLDAPYYHSLDDKSEELVEALKDKIINRKFSHPRMSLVIADKQNKLLGSVSSYWQSKETNWLSIGLVIYDPQNWGKGIGKEALSLWIEYLFKYRPELVRLDLRTWSGNIGMMKLAVSLGFLLEARFRKARIVEGEYFDGLGYGLLKSEWLKIKQH